jgi:predicted RNA-binding Zn ribbon-like protein
VLREPLPVEFMNTIWADRDGIHDTLADEHGLAQWLSGTALAGTALAGTALAGTALAGTGLDDAALDDAALRRFRALRDALRVLAAEITGDTRPIAGEPAQDVAAAVSTVNRTCAAAPSWSQLLWPGSGEPSRCLVTGAAAADSVLARLAEAGAALLGSDQAAQLGACLAPGCVLYFLRDHPRRQWCSDGCGNRARVARHYARHHAPPAGPGAAADGLSDG